jgi:tRNA(adenine34) deaminase
MSSLPSFSADEEFMQQALILAQEAASRGEIPVGALLVYQNNIIAAASNSNREEHNPIKHAEIKVIEDGCRHFNNERLIDCDLYVTKEPCAMCAGAIIHARIRRVFIGAEDIKYGACGTVFNICGNDLFNHAPEIIFGVLKNECRTLIQTFFADLRKKR